MCMKCTAERSVHSWHHRVPAPLLTMRRTPCTSGALASVAPGAILTAMVVPGLSWVASICCRRYQPICQPCTTLGQRLVQQWPMGQVLSKYLRHLQGRVGARMPECRQVGRVGVHGSTAGWRAMGWPRPNRN